MIINSLDSLDKAIMRDIQLHEQIELIYVVDGWQVNYSADDGNTYEKFQAGTPVLALIKCFSKIRNKRGRK